MFVKIQIYRPNRQVCRTNKSLYIEGYITTSFYVMNWIDKAIVKRANKIAKRAEVAPTTVETTTSALNSLFSNFREQRAVVGQEEALRISTTYACVEIISNSVAQLPIRPFRTTENGRTLAKDDSTYELLVYNPNEQMTRFTLLDLLVKSMLLYGNGYAKIVRDFNGVARSIYFQDPRDVVAFIVDTKHGRAVDHYYNARTHEVIEPNDMIHLLNFSIDGVEGISTIKYACYSLGLAQAAELHASNFYDGGGTLSGILSVVDGRLNDSKRQQIREQWEEQVAGGTVAVLDGDMRYQPISVNPDDAQLLETRKFSVEEICRFFKVSPVKVFDLSHSSYSTVEAVNISFLVDTLTPYLEKIELEFRKKIYPPEKRKEMELDFDTRNLIRADSAAQANLYNTLHTIGAVTPNEVREVFNLDPIEGGDKAFTQVNMQTLEQFKGNNNDGE